MTLPAFRREGHRVAVLLIRCANQWATVIACLAIRPAIKGALARKAAVPWTSKDHQMSNVRIESPNYWNYWGYHLQLKYFCLWCSKSPKRDIDQTLHCDTKLKTHLRPNPLLKSRCNGSPRYTVQCSNHMGNPRPLANTCQCHSSRSLHSAQLRNCEQRHLILWSNKRIYQMDQLSQLQKTHIFFFNSTLW